MHLRELFYGSLIFQQSTVEPRFIEVAGDRPNLFVKSRVHEIENLDITNLRGNDQKVRYIHRKKFLKHMHGFHFFPF